MSEQNDVLFKICGEFMAIVQAMIKVYNDENGIDNFKTTYSKTKIAEIYKVGDAITRNQMRAHILQGDELVLRVVDNAGFTQGQMSLVKRQMAFLRKVVHTTLTLEDQNEIFYPGMHPLLIRQTKAYRQTNMMLSIVNGVIEKFKVVDEDDEAHLSAAFDGAELVHQKERIAAIKFAALEKSLQDQIEQELAPVAEYRARVLALSHDIATWMAGEGQATRGEDTWFAMDRAYYWCRNVTTMFTKRINGYVGYRFPKLSQTREVDPTIVQIEHLHVSLAELVQKM